MLQRQNITIKLNDSYWHFHEGKQWCEILRSWTLEYAQLTVSFLNDELDTLVYQQGQEPFISAKGGESI